MPAQADIVGGDARPLTDAGGEGTAQKSLFLRKVHESACGIFTSVLGSEANEAHRNHLHVDLAQRRIRCPSRVASSMWTAGKMLCQSRS